MRKLRLKYYIILLLACLSLTSVGFASWIISDPASAETSGIIEVEDVIKSSDFITCDPSTITKFSYFKTGFVNENNEIVTTGSISANVTIIIDQCKLKFADTNTLEINFMFEQSDLGVFKSDNNMTYTAVVKEGDNTLTSTTTYNNTLCLTSFNIANFKSRTDNINITITYNFEILNQDYFASTVFPKLHANDFKFTLSAKLAGKEVV